MFFRVLGAMVVADAIDRRARKRTYVWSGQAASHEAVASTPRAPDEAPIMPSKRPRTCALDPQTPERPSWRDHR